MAPDVQSPSTRSPIFDPPNAARTRLHLISCLVTALSISAINACAAVENPPIGSKATATPEGEPYLLLTSRKVLNLGYCEAGPLPARGHSQWIEQQLGRAPLPNGVYCSGWNPNPQSPGYIPIRVRNLVTPPDDSDDGGTRRGRMANVTYAASPWNDWLGIGHLEEAVEKAQVGKPLPEGVADAMVRLSTTQRGTLRAKELVGARFPQVYEAIALGKPRFDGTFWSVPGVMVVSLSGPMLQAGPETVQARQGTLVATGPGGARVMPHRMSMGRGVSGGMALMLVEGLRVLSDVINHSKEAAWDLSVVQPLADGSVEILNGASFKTLEDVRAATDAIWNGDYTFTEKKGPMMRVVKSPKTETGTGRPSGFDPPDYEDMDYCQVTHPGTHINCIGDYDAILNDDLFLGTYLLASDASAVTCPVTVGYRKGSATGTISFGGGHITSPDIAQVFDRGPFFSPSGQPMQSHAKEVSVNAFLQSMGCSGIEYVTITN